MISKMLEENVEKRFFFGQNVVEEEKKVCANWTANVSNVEADTSI